MGFANQVPDDGEFERVSALPRRKLTREDADVWSEVLTPEFACAGSGSILRPWQALALAEAAENDGAWLALPVGLGKTLICELLPVIMKSKRAVLIMPAALRDDKAYGDRAELQGKWRMASPPPTILSLEGIVRDENIFNKHRPDLIIVDEADTLANPTSGAALIIEAYLLANPRVRVVCMTGTPSRNSIMGYWHQLCWCLRERAPVPMSKRIAEMWASAIDNGGGRSGFRTQPGPMGGDIDAARAWYAMRLAETPGVVIVDGDSAGDIPISIEIILANEDPLVDEVYRDFMLRQRNPAGIPVSDPLSRFRMDSQLGCGVYQYLEPPPPEDWALARRDVARLVRSQTGKRVDGKLMATEARVIKAFAGHPAVKEWLAIRDDYDPEPNIKVDWFSDSAVESAVEWYEEYALDADTPAIIWCGFTEFAEELARASKLPYYSRKGTNAQGGKLGRADRSTSLIASWHANKRGFNLQPWRRQLVIQPPQSAKYLEQMFGRSHRAGQTDPVEIYVLATSGGTLDGFEQSISEAGFAKSTVLITQKILRADITRATPHITARNKYRWAREAA